MRVVWTREVMNTWGESFDLQAMLKEFADLKGEVIDLRVEVLSLKDQWNSMTVMDAPLQARVLPRNRIGKETET
jgi:hypothetical protein